VQHVRDIAGQGRRIHALPDDDLVRDTGHATQRSIGNYSPR
jgi:hypothetical protein